MKRFLALILAAIMMFSLTACVSDSGSSNGKKSKKTNVEDKSLKIEDLEWTAEEGIVSGDRVLTFSVTNNSKYTIKDLDFTYTQKSGVTDEQIATFWENIQKQLDLENDEVAELKENSDEISLTANVYSATNPGETNSTGRMNYFNGIFYCNDASAIELVEPDIARITYVDGDLLKTVYYDFHSKKYTEDNATEKAYQWSTFPIGDKVPKPDVKILTATIDYEKTFDFDAYGIDLDMYAKYVEQCKALGFTTVSTNMDDMYSAKNDAGDSIIIYYRDDTNMMNVTVRLNNAEDNEKTEDTESETEKAEDDL